MGKTLLLLSGSETGVAQQLHDKGYTVAIMDANPEAPAFAFAASCLIADVWQASDCAAAAERYNRKIRKIDGVLLAADAPMTAAAVCARLRLPGLPLHVAELANDRLAAKRAFLSAGVASPWHAEISTPQELQRLIITHGRDLVLKPSEQLGPSTVMHLLAMEDPAAAYQKIRAASTCRTPDGGADKWCCPTARILAGRDLLYEGTGGYSHTHRACRIGTWHQRRAVGGRYHATRWHAATGRIVAAA